jgi:hypothetical protein
LFFVEISLRALRLCGGKGVNGGGWLRSYQLASDVLESREGLSGRLINIINQWIGDSRPQGEIDTRFRLTLREVY